MKTLNESLLEDMKVAMKQKDKNRLESIRLIRSSIKQYEVDKRLPATDEVITDILTKMAKQRKESIAQFQKASREDLIEIEQSQLSIIESYLPEQLSDDEIAEHVKRVVEELQINSIRDMGKAMASLKTALAGKADMSKVSQLLKSMLA
jgi:uncharacterized protein YqeY